MGYAACVSVSNATNDSIIVTLTDERCMYDHDQGEGSNPSYLNNLTIPPQTTCPPSGQGGNGQCQQSGGQYCEADSAVGSGCATSPSTFDLEFVNESNSEFLGTAYFVEDGEQWDVTTNRPNNIYSNVDNSTNPAIISISIVNTSS